jgi:hypothetical protein
MRLGRSWSSWIVVSDSIDLGSYPRRDVPTFVSVKCHDPTMSNNRDSARSLPAHDRDPARSIKREDFWKETAERIFWRFRAEIVEELLIPLFYFDNHFVVFFLKFWDSP